MKQTELLLGCAFLLMACGRQSFDEKCEREARDYTARHCPMPIEQNVMFDSMVYHRGQSVMAYCYTLSGSLDQADVIRQNATVFKQKLVEAVRNSVEMKKYTQKGIRIDYLYHSASTGKLLLKVEVGPDDEETAKRQKS